MCWVPQNVLDHGRISGAWDVSFTLYEFQDVVVLSIDLVHASKQRPYKSPLGLYRQFHL